MYHPTLTGLEMLPAFPLNYVRQRNPATSLDSEVASVVDASVRSLLDPLIGRFWSCVGCLNRLFGRTNPEDELEDWVMISVQNGQIKEVKKEPGEITQAEPPQGMIEFD